ncbi:DUF2769 domain-containing protein [Methanolobus sp. ZRKC3]|uniref:DUF2769 domain-containing protein n=1 Tax=Methanolobus sp. ZRKC3 TaxID=3125786 RepID=UPI00324A8A44
MENRGKYFGICTSYHHSKGCKCKQCPSYPEDGSFMFCSKGRSKNPRVEAVCLCHECFIFQKFRLEGDNFCKV